MHTFTLTVLCSLFAFLTSALPATPGASLKEPERSPDRCGPIATLQNASSDPQDTCSAVPSTDSKTTSYKIAFIPPSTPSVPGSVDWTLCPPPIDQLCEAIATNATAAKGSWLFTTEEVPTRKRTLNCQVGIYIPSDPSAAPRPEQKQCKAILESLISASMDIQNSGRQLVQGATVNLKDNPAAAEGQFPLPGGSGTGYPFNTAYPSWVFNTQIESYELPPGFTCRDPFFDYDDCPGDGMGEKV
ncbi:MAG: hypothetical protein Q9186_004158 [Xanthomendoza sp. 1 TL-2023]